MYVVNTSLRIIVGDDCFLVFDFLPLSISISKSSSPYNDTIWFANLLSFISLCLSNIKYIKSKRLKSEGGSLIFCITLNFGSYFECIGFALAKIAVRAFN